MCYQSGMKCSLYCWCSYLCQHAVGAYRSSCGLEASADCAPVSSPLIWTDDQCSAAPDFGCLSRERGHQPDLCLPLGVPCCVGGLAGEGVFRYPPPPIWGPSSLVAWSTAGLNCTSPCLLGELPELPAPKRLVAVPQGTDAVATLPALQGGLLHRC